MTRSGRLAATAGVTVTALLSLLGGAADGRAAPAPPKFKYYLAMGDSYTAAPLVPPLDLSTLACLRSGGNYPALLATKLKVPKVTDVSCGGADSTHLQTAQATPAGFVPAQFDALAKTVDLVTLGIGGNDFGVLAALFAVCPSLRSSDPDGAPCKKRFTVGGKDQLKENVTKTKARLTAAVKTIRPRIAPKATIVLVGYPTIAPAKTVCADLPLAKGDYAYLNATVIELNKAIQAAAKTTGAKYVDIFKASTGHDVCAKEKAWIQGKDPDLLKAAAFHPRAEEQAAVADLIVKSLSGRQLSISSAEQEAWSPGAAERRRQSVAVLDVPANRDRLTERLRQNGLFPAAPRT
ncbi:SGNH/GDSL hydrolase family protein [Kribbella sp. CA-293567]|uniref:SGNH/GDSL hydrolase family protein n=1 Tax=Kribbella sp. CA-293567 TaxID=3002436 RepID=UPI0022DDCD44|nr:SGNH/GDSL hydrolase family protein [Kribbella sp. CA-293567]WBQ04475.1 SGNH/GDSL hydrolase family protein [Kribbella sp. CA-293567]